MTSLNQARALLTSVTPLQFDCGRLCRHACCSSLEGEETGMLVFPGEEEYLTDPGFRFRSKDGRTIVLCGSSCQREGRPLSCMLFPLLPILREDTIKVVVDPRSRAICPLAGQPLAGFSEGFVAAVRQAGEILAADPVQRQFLLQLTEEYDQWKALQKAFGRND